MSGRTEEDAEDAVLSREPFGNVYDQLIWKSSLSPEDQQRYDRALNRRYYGNREAESK